MVLPKIRLGSPHPAPEFRSAFTMCSNCQPTKGRFRKSFSRITLDPGLCFIYLLLMPGNPPMITYISHKKTDKMKQTRTLLLIFIVLLNVSCNDCNVIYVYEPPLDIADGLKTGTMQEAGMDTALINKCLERIKCGGFNEIHSMLIYKDGMLVLEEYFKGYKYQWDAPDYRGEHLQWNRDMMHPIMSCSKSYTSACIGIAIDKGYIGGVRDRIFDYLPDHKAYRNGGRENITIEHLLTMTSGLEWNEWSTAHGTSANDIDRLIFECSGDPLKCVLERELIHAPGETFNYNGGGVVILGEILRNATGMNIDEFSRQFLFGPLGVDSVNWYQYDNGVFETEGSMYITPRDMLKFGVTYLNNGVWNDTRILSQDWIKKSSEIYNNNKGIKIPIEDSGKNGYGYLWWVSRLDHKGKEIKMYRANGWGGQTIMVFPELEMVVVFTSGNYAAKSKLFKIIERYLLPATI